MGEGGRNHGDHVHPGHLQGSMITVCIDHHDRHDHSHHVDHDHGVEKVKESSLGSKTEA